MSTHAPDFSKPFAMAGPAQPKTTEAQPRPNRRGWAVALVSIAVAAAYVTLVFLPGQKAIDELHNQIEMKRQFVEQGSGLAALLQAQKEALARANAYKEQWQSRCPPVETRSSIEGRIHALAEAAGVTTTRFDPEPVVPQETISRVPVSIGCRGTFTQVGDFLNSLESLPTLVWVTSVHLEKADTSRKLIDCNLSLVMFADNSGISDYAKESP